MDLHSHSHNSADASSAVLDMIGAAKAAGIGIYAITDHCEINRFFPLGHYGARKSRYEYETYDNSANFEGSMSELTAVKEQITGIKLLCGVELGQATADPGLAASLVKDKRLDIVLASAHELPGKEDFAFIDYSTYSDSELNVLVGDYFTEIERLCLWGHFDILSHLTYTLRYIVGKAKRTVNMELFEESIRESFKILIKSGKGIEINSSGLRQKNYGKTFPDFYYVKLFRDMGGEIITVGSDSHMPEDVGTGIAEAIEIAKAAGFDRLTYFEKREPHFVAI
jgi:histidinol-phosphatase (PHP family)